MNNILIKSQSGMNIIPTIISIGYRQPVMVIGDKVKELMKNKKMEVEDLIKDVGNSYRDNITRILNNEEIPKPKMVAKLVEIFEVESDYFEDKELGNVVCVQGGTIVGKYETNKRAEEVTKELQKLQEDAFINNKTVIYVMPER